MRHLIHAAAVLALAALTASAQEAPAQQGDSLPDFARRASAEHPQPGDRVWLHVWREPKLSDTVTVDERGDVMFPKIGIINAASLTIGAFRDTVRTRFAEFLRDASIEIEVLRRVTVNGAVARPNVYYVDLAATVRDVIARAGGVSDAGDTKSVLVIRDGRRIRVFDWQQDRSAASDLRSGDQIIVPRRSWLSMNLLPALSVTTGVGYFLLVIFRR